MYCDFYKDDDLHVGYWKNGRICVRFGPVEFRPIEGEPIEIEHEYSDMEEDVVMRSVMRHASDEILLKARRVMSDMIERRGAVIVYLQREYSAKIRKARDVAKAQNRECDLNELLADLQEAAK